MTPKPVTVVCLSDTHGHFPKNMPPGDILVHTGDFSNSMADIPELGQWLSGLPYAHKIVIAGNHDVAFEKLPQRAQELLRESSKGSVIYLQDSSTTACGLKIYGSPWQPRFYNWAFNLDRGPQIEEKWKLIPEDTDILLTHGPPHGILDQCPDIKGPFSRHRNPLVHVGCEMLLKHVNRVKPKLHVFGHIHEGAGSTTVNGTTFINASIMSGRYQPIHQPTIITLHPK